MRFRRGPQLLPPVVGQRGVRDARVRSARLLADVACALEPFEEARDAGGGQHDLLGEVDAAHPAVVGVREVQQHLVVVQRQVVLTLELRGELARDRRVGAEEGDPAFELERR